MTRLELWARNIVIAALGVGAGYISLGHVYDFAMNNSLPGTDPAAGIIVAFVSELMPVGVALHYRTTRQLGPFAVFLLLLAAGFSLWAQIATAKPSVAGYAVAAFTTLAFMGLVKLIISGGKEVDQAGQSGSVRPSLVPATIGAAAARPAVGADSVGRELGSGPAATTGKGATGPDESVTPPVFTADGGDKPTRSAASRAKKVAAVQAARRELGKKATQGEIAERVGCSTATVSRIESQLRPPGSGEPEARSLVLEVVNG